MSVHFYTAENIRPHSLSAYRLSDAERTLLYALLTEPLTRFVANTDATLQAVCIGDSVLPLVIANPEAHQNSYVCSPTTHYLDYAREELDIELQDHPMVHRLLDYLIRGARGVFVPLHFEKVVFVNNWLLSTNLYPELAYDRLEEVKQELVKRFPEHAIIFRSINTRLNQELYDALSQLGFQATISRQVYLLNAPEKVHRKRHPFKEDLRLSRRSTYHWRSHEDLTVPDIPRLKALYDALYLKKYSLYNPQFTAYFFQQSLKHQWLHYRALEKNGRIDAMIAYTYRNGIMTTPMVGYDLSLPRRTSLYPQITAKIFTEAENLGFWLHHSSGVSRFKMNRGCTPAMEYNLIYSDHLSPAQQVPWRLLHKISKHIADPLFRKLEL